MLLTTLMTYLLLRSHIYITKISSFFGSFERRLQKKIPDYLIKAIWDGVSRGFQLIALLLNGVIL